MNSNTIHIVSNDHRVNSLVASAAWEFEPNATIQEYESPEQFLNARTSTFEGSWEVLATSDANLQLPVSKRNLYMPIVKFTSQKVEGHDLSNAAIDFDTDQPIYVGSIQPFMQEAIAAARLFLKLKSNASRMSTLTNRERRVVVLAADGVPNKSIAKRLDVSVKTIEKIRRNAYLKLSVKSSAEVASLVTFNRFIGMNNLLSIPSVPLPTSPNSV